MQLLLSQFQYPNVARVAVVDDRFVSGREDEALGAGGSNQEAVCGISVRLPWQESALGG